MILDPHCIFSWYMVHRAMKTNNLSQYYFFRLLSRKKRWNKIKATKTDLKEKSSIAQKISANKKDLTETISKQTTVLWLVILRSETLQLSPINGGHPRHWKLCVISSMYVRIVQNSNLELRGCVFTGYTGKDNHQDVKGNDTKHVRCVKRLLCVYNQITFLTSHYSTFGFEHGTSAWMWKMRWKMRCWIRKRNMFPWSKPKLAVPFSALQRHGLSLHRCLLLLPVHSPVQPLKR